MEPDGGMMAFGSRPMPRLVFGPGEVEQVGRLAGEFGGHRALIVTDPGIVAAGHAEHVIQSLRAEGIRPTLFDGVVENPTVDEVELCVNAARAYQTDIIIGLGGGSSLDTAKGCNFLFTNGGKMEDYRGRDKATKKMLPFIAIPTTAGTGSECQGFALIADPITHQKMPCGDAKAMAKAAILDPDLTLTQPALVTACTGLDALAHAIESYVSKAANDWSRVFAGHAFGLIHEHLSTVLTSPENREARAAMLLGASMAGISIENSMLGCAHSAANPLTARFGTVHGHAVSLILPHVIRRNAEDELTAELYAALLAQSPVESRARTPQEAAEILASEIEQLLELSGLALDLASAGIISEEIPSLAQSAAQQWTANFNPRNFEPADFETIYREAYQMAETV